jgi:hypothetical protein
MTPSADAELTVQAFRHSLGGRTWLPALIGAVFLAAGYFAVHYFLNSWLKW